MRCKQARLQISLDLDQRLSPALRAALEAHLSACGPCRQARAELSAAWDLLGQFAAPQGPDDWRLIAARVDASPRGIRTWLADLWLASPGRLATAAVLSLFVLAGAAGGTWLARGVQPHLQPAMPLEAVAMGEAFGDVPGAAWLAHEGKVQP